MRHTRRAVEFASIAAISLCASAAHSRNLSDILQDKRFARLELGQIAPVLAGTVASTYPVASASASVTYVYDPAMGTFERRTGVVGPIFGERAETIGRGQFNLAASYSYVRLTSINGDDLGELENRRIVGNRVIVFPVPGGITLKDGRFTNILPVRVVADLDVEAHILAPSLTYGVTPDLDVNLTVPLIHTAFDVTAETEVPDPRFPQFALSRPPTRGSRSLSDSADGVGDVLLRAKYVLRRGRPFDIAAGLGVKLPTGDEDDFQGTGDTRVQPTLVLSRVLAERFQPLLNLGIDLNADDVDRSIVRWALGGTVQVVGSLTGALVFLGRHELEEQTEQITRPFFFQIERNDIIDASVGLRYRLGESGVIAANAVLPLNDDGLRADVIPTVEFEYAF
jgi:hypothetical protein